MPISVRFLFFARPALGALRLIRFEGAGPLHGPSPAEARQAELVRELSRRLPPRLLRDVLPDGD